MRASRFAAGCALLAWSAAPAQTAARVVEGRVVEGRVVEGRVVRPGAQSMQPVQGAWVVLHRVGADKEGPLDSTRTGASGAYTFRFTPFGRDDAIYFLATMHDGIAYLSSPLKQPRVTGADAEITVFDTTSSRIRLRERGRHVIVFAPRADGTREVFEVYEIANDGQFTLIPGGRGKPSWSAILSDAAIEFKAEQGDVSAAAIVGSKGRAEIYAPFAPGLKQVTFSYRLPASAFPFAVPAAADTLVLEVLLEEQGSGVTGGGLKAIGGQVVDGHKFARFLSPDAPPGAAVRVTAGGAPRGRGKVAVIGLVIILAGAMAVAMVAGLRAKS